MALEVGVVIIFAGAVVAIAADGLVRGQSFQPIFIVLVQAALIVVDEHAGRDMHGVYQAHYLRDAAFVPMTLGTIVHLERVLRNMTQS